MITKFAVRSLDKNIKNLEFMSCLRRATLHPSSGMNKELNALTARKNYGDVIDAKAIILYSAEEVLAWALFSREESNCCFNYKFKPSQGILFQIYVEPKYRKLGFAQKIINKAAKMAKGRPLCVIPWDDQSHAFFIKNKDLKLKSLSDYYSL